MIAALTLQATKSQSRERSAAANSRAAAGFVKKSGATDGDQRPACPPTGVQELLLDEPIEPRGTVEEPLFDLEHGAG